MILYLTISSWCCDLMDDLTRPVNCFKANKEIINICGNSPKVRPQGDGSLVIEISSPDESERLLKVTKLHGHKVSCIPHPTYNQSKGVIYAPELLTIDTEEIQSELKEQNVVTVVRMMKKVENGHIPLPTLILTFNSYRLPNIIKAGWLTFKVKPFIPSPLRCFHCQIFGHSIQNCRKKLNQEPAVCVNCGKAAHGECKDTPSCINCGGEHSASSKSYLSIYISWPFPPVWGGADNTQETTKTMGVSLRSSSNDEGPS